jgi:sterol desaturase/sphingolipid hydroxylase (fatty acid hydroxylase superfamily)
MRREIQSRALGRALDAIPRYYDPYLHLAGTAGVGFVTLAAGLLSIHRLRPIELLVVPVMFLVSNVFEWHAHKNALHQRRWPLEVLYDRHTPEHHVVYQYDSMAIRSVREFRLVLIPAAGVATVVLVTAPLAYGAGRLLTANCGWLALVTSAVYMVTYELSHLSYHLPEDSFVGRRALVRVLREHHRRHHHPALMQRWNFNVTLPLFDWLFGTTASKALVDEVLRRR